MNDRGQYGSTPTWAVAIIATGVGVALKSLWDVAAKKRDVLVWKAR